MTHNPPRVRMNLREGRAEFTVDGRPYAELTIPGDEGASEHRHGVLLRMVETAYQKGVSDARAAIREELGIR